MNTLEFVGEHARTYNVQWHSHPLWELVYCTGGHGCFCFEGGTELHYRAGDAVAIPPGLRHCNHSGEGFTNIHITLAEATLSPREPFRVTDDAEQHLQTAFREARFYFISDIAQRELLLSALGGLIAGYMVVYHGKSSFSAPVEQLRSVIINRYCEPSFALDEAISSLPFHYDYIRKLFKKELGLSPLEYLTKLRMKKAELLAPSLQSRSCTVAEMAELCGYDNALYFSRVFRKHFGCSPSQYAQRV